MVKAQYNNSDKGVAATLDAKVDGKPDGGLAGMIEDAACGFWMGCNWVSTWWYEQPMELISWIRYSGGTHACDRIASKYRMDERYAKPVTAASEAVGVGYGAGILAYALATAACAGAAAFSDCGWHALLATPTAVRTARAAASYPVSWALKAVSYPAALVLSAAEWSFSVIANPGQKPDWRDKGQKKG